MKIPKVFISYSHDSPEHKKWVLDFAGKLTSRGIDVSLDQWDLGPGSDLPNYMEKKLSDSDYVLIICTKEYTEKANSGKGGVGYEKMIITADLIKDIDTKKFIPIIKQIGSYTLPTFLKTKLFIDLSQAKNYEFNFDELLRTLHNSPLYKKPEIGKNPFSQKTPEPIQKNNPLDELMKIVALEYENGASHSNLSDIKKTLNISRILLDFTVDQAKDFGLVEDSRVFHNSIVLTRKGKIYVIENGLVKL